VGGRSPQRVIVRSRPCDTVPSVRLDIVSANPPTRASRLRPCVRHSCSQLRAGSHRCTTSSSRSPSGGTRQVDPRLEMPSASCNAAGAISHSHPAGDLLPDLNQRANAVADQARGRTPQPAARGGRRRESRSISLRSGKAAESASLQESKNAVRWHTGVGVSGADAQDLAAHRPRETSDRSRCDHDAGLPGLYAGPHRESTGSRNG
jgi:hypothetical protein